MTRPEALHEAVLAPGPLLGLAIAALDFLVGQLHALDHVVGHALPVHRQGMAVRGGGGVGAVREASCSWVMSSLCDHLRDAHARPGTRPSPRARAPMARRTRPSPH